MRNASSCLTKNAEIVLQQITGGLITDGIIERALKVVARSKRHKMVVLTGAGASMPYNIPAMKDLHDICKAKSKTPVKGVPYERFYLHVGGADLENIITASYLFRRAGELSENGPGRDTALAVHKDLFKWTIKTMVREIRNSLNLDELKVKRSYRALDLLDEKYGLAFFTTNYDLVFEKIGNENLHVINQIKDADTVFDKSQIFVKLHGCVTTENETKGILPPFLSKSVSQQGEEFDRYRFLYAVLAFSIVQSKGVVIIGQSLRDSALRFLVNEACAIAGAKQYIINSNPGQELKEPDSRLGRAFFIKQDERFGESGFLEVVDKIALDMKEHHGRRRLTSYNKREFKEFRLNESLIIRDFNIVTRYRELTGDFLVRIKESDSDWDSHCKVCSLTKSPGHNLYNCILMNNAMQWDIKIKDEREKSQIMKSYAQAQIEKAANVVAEQNYRTYGYYA